MMKITLSPLNNGKLISAENEVMKIPFGCNLGPCFYVTEKDLISEVTLKQNQKYYEGNYKEVTFRLSYEVLEDGFVLKSIVKNNGLEAFSPQNIGICPGIDCYMDGYPHWNDKVFPTMLRCEKLHFWGYFMNPGEKAVAVVCEEPIASYHIDYNYIADGDCGHRIYTVNLDLFHSGPLPKRHPDECAKLLPETEYKFNLYFITLNDLSELNEKVTKYCDIPLIESEKYTVENGEMPVVKIYSQSDCKYEWIEPDGTSYKNIQRCHEFGLYTLRVTNEAGKVSEAMFYCRLPLNDYLSMARTEALRKPQKATTHAESWYGFFSAFLAAKYDPNADEDANAESLFNEVAPLMFDLENCRPIILPERIQNTATFISVLVDKYQANPQKNKKDLFMASKFGDWLMTKQNNQGVYVRNQTLHYTSVIYPAKSMLELAKVELTCGNDELCTRGTVHFESAKHAVDELVSSLERIGTEGEHTLEDGMISCSALQLGMLALELSEDEREKYISAAKYMLKLHSCLEQKRVPDCRINGGSLRFWEAQYDVMMKVNFMNSPHGWTAWTIYAKYYLYLLTGELSYLTEAVNSMGACLQLMELNGNLRWAFAVDPFINAECFVSDNGKPVQDGYRLPDVRGTAFRGKYIKSVVGEQYIDMISGWFRSGSQKVTGGFIGCPLYLENNVVEYVDAQGGACDNDVHEIFKCLEETFLDKAFVAQREDGSFYTSQCLIDDKNSTISLIDNVSQLHINIKAPQKFTVISSDGIKTSVEVSVKPKFYSFCHAI